MGFHKGVVAFLLCLLLVSSGCGKVEEKPLPVDFTRDTMGYYCGMALVEHQGPKGQIHVAGESGILWFSSVRDAFSFLVLEGATRRIRAFYINDMTQAIWEKPGPWIDGEKAYYVIGSGRRSTMGESEIIPFASQAAADTYQKEHGGQVLPYSRVTPAL